ncbi:MAG: efflux RND transporter periplasmic adaptor subunit [Candidatus Omnitrophica bacterium]|nr:efflux RND transporter periplasmic adaptor subunit [Candidatus Omnitrophota bacterium]
MNKKRKILFIIILVSLVACVLIFMKMRGGRGPAEVTREIKPAMGSMQVVISSTGTVYPKNRLEIKPPVNGRVEEILVKEGESVRTGQILAYMSSTERAALLDAASDQGEEKLKRWQKIYKAIPLRSPIKGEVIVATTQPGQTVSTADAVIVLSDQLIVRAQVDETDIGKIHLGQEAAITLDAYPDTKIKAKVDHIYYESQTVNNVIVYKVDLVPEDVPDFFRSGMSASVDFIVENKENTLILPVEAVQQDKGEDYVLLKQEGSIKPVKRVVKLGIAEGDNYEILSGITAADTILVMTNESVSPAADSNTGSNPFMPKFPKQKKN